MKNNPMLERSNRIWLPGYSPVSYEDAFPWIQFSQRHDNPENEDAWCFRPNPFAGEHGVLDIDNISTQAVLQTLIDVNGRFSGSFRRSIFEFLNPAEIGLDSSPYQQRLPLVGKLFREFDRYVTGASYCHVTDEGFLFDPTSSYMVNFESTPHYTIRRGNSDRFTVTFDTQWPDTSFMPGDDYDTYMFKLIKDRHLERNLFKNGPVEFIHRLGYGFHVPIIGVTEIVGYEERGEFPKYERVRVRLSEDGVDFPSG
jgi:hypothetical protein